MSFVFSVILFVVFLLLFCLPFVFCLFFSYVISFVCRSSRLPVCGGMLPSCRVVCDRCCCLCLILFCGYADVIYVVVRCSMPSCCGYERCCGCDEGCGRENGVIVSDWALFETWLLVGKSMKEDFFFFSYFIFHGCAGTPEASSKPYYTR